MLVEADLAATSKSSHHPLHAWGGVATSREESRRLTLDRFLPAAHISTAICLARLHAHRLSTRSINPNANGDPLSLLHFFATTVISKHSTHPNQARMASFLGDRSAAALFETLILSLETIADLRPEKAAEALRWMAKVLEEPSVKRGERGTKRAEEVARLVAEELVRRTLGLTVDVEAKKAAWRQRQGLMGEETKEGEGQCRGKGRGDGGGDQRERQRPWVTVE